MYPNCQFWWTKSKNKQEQEVLKISKCNIIRACYPTKKICVTLSSLAAQIFFLLKFPVRSIKISCEIKKNPCEPRHPGYLIKNSLWDKKISFVIKNSLQTSAVSPNCQDTWLFPSLLPIKAPLKKIVCYFCPVIEIMNSSLRIHINMALWIIN